MNKIATCVVRHGLLEKYGSEAEFTKYVSLAVNNHDALVEALRPFVGLLQAHNEHQEHSRRVFEINGHAITIGHLRTARALLDKIAAEAKGETP